MVIFNYTGSLGEKILRKALGGLLFLTHTVEFDRPMDRHSHSKCRI